MDETKEKQILEQFRAKLGNVGRDDAVLLRFLREVALYSNLTYDDKVTIKSFMLPYGSSNAGADFKEIYWVLCAGFLIPTRDHDIPRATEMFEKSMKWREENDMDGFRKWTLSQEVIHSFPYGCYGRDNEKRLVYYFPVGSWEVRQMINEGHSEDMLKLMLHSMEDIIGKIDESGNEHFSLIVDLEDLTYWKVAHYETIQMVLKVFRDFEQNYPERLGEAFVINAPWVLNYVWPLVKPLLHGRTMQKVRFLGSDSSKFIPQLLERMTPEAISPKLCDILKTLRNNNAQA